MDIGRIMYLAGSHGFVAPSGRLVALSSGFPFRALPPRLVFSLLARDANPAPRLIVSAGPPCVDGHLHAVTPTFAMGTDDFDVRSIVDARFDPIECVVDAIRRIIERLCKIAGVHALIM